MKERRLLIDDTRSETSKDYKGDLVGRVDVIARNYWEGIRQLKDNGPWDVLLLDHDLSSYHPFDPSKELTGYDIMCWLEEYPRNEYLPKKIRFVSSNPEGRARMEVVRRKIYGDSY